MKWVFKRQDLQNVSSQSKQNEHLSPTWSCRPRQRDTTSDEWKLNKKKFNIITRHIVTSIWWTNVGNIHKNLKARAVPYHNDATNDVK